MNGRRIRKVMIIIILFVFLLITGLTSVMYLTGNSGTPADTNSGADLLSGTETTVVETPAVDTGKALPTMTKEEAAQQLQNLLSGVKATK